MPTQHRATAAAVKQGRFFLRIAVSENRPGFSVDIVFENSIDGKTMKTIKCTGCYAVSYTEKWEEGRQYYEQVRVSCQNIQNGAAKYENQWA